MTGTESRSSRAGGLSSIGRRPPHLLAAGKAFREGDAIIYKIEPGRTIEVHDLIHGTITFETDNIKDQVLIKSDGSPAYNFSCVVDDAELRITHILRGDDHLSNTPKQILFYEAFGLEPPQFGHMPLILGPDGAKLSKRHGGVSVEEYRKEGFLSEALANYLILLGWYPGESRDIIPLAEAVKEFDISGMNDVQAKFDLQKLRWMNGEYIISQKTEELLPLVKEQLLAAGYDLSAVRDESIGQVLGLYKIRIKTLSEFPAMTDFFFRDDFVVENEAILQLKKEETKVLLELFAERLETLEDFRQENIDRVCRELAQKRGIKAAVIIHPVRVAVSGKTKGAGLFEMMEVLGKEKVLKRIRGALT